MNTLDVVLITIATVIALVIFGIGIGFCFYKTSQYDYYE